MICQLEIKNIALINSLSISLEKGFNILSGETGAGKSIIVDAVNLILGSRADKDLIRAGESSARVQALIEIDNHEELKKVLSEYDIEGEELIVSRELSVSGRNVCKINGQLVTLAALKQIMSRFVDISGQNDNITLLDENYHLELVDSFAGMELASVKKLVADAYADYSSIRKQYDNLQRSIKEKNRMADLYRYQSDEIARYKLTPGEDDSLEAEKNIMENSEEIANRLFNTKNALSSDSGAREKLYRAMINMQKIADLDERYANIEKVITDAYYAIDEISYDVSDLSAGLDFSETRLEQIEDRLHDINSLKKKYGATIEEILEYKKECDDSLELLDNSEYELSRLEKALAQNKAVLEEKCRELSALRKEYSKKFEIKLKKELADLGMKDASFESAFSKKDFTANGWDEYSFMLSVNKGTPPRPLSKIASGGELSRIMLAIKNICSDSTFIDTMIFDEIDTGISGTMAQKVALKMCNIAKNKQVICVTHLPQIAAIGDANFFIQKKEIEGVTQTTLTRLNDEALTVEVSRLSGGLQSKTSHEHAMELIESARKEKNSIYNS